jgi:hypothetical protein
MMRVLTWRERKSRLALAKVTRSVADARKRIETLDGIVSAVEARVKESYRERLTGGRTVAALSELEQHTKSLRSARERVAGMRQQSAQKLDELRDRQRVEARQWRRDEAKLTHVKAMARREVIARESREAETEEAERGR